MTTSISPQELNSLWQQDNSAALLDVRTPAEFREVHVEFARNVPLERLDPTAVARAFTQLDGRPLYAICQPGGREKQACERLLNAGIQASNVSGGTQAWAAAGLPVARGQKTISLERQVRIAAGSLVLIGSVLGMFVHPYFIGLAALVGGGLVFSGITDTCGMGMLLARMPWNQTPSSTTDTCRGVTN